MMISIVVPIYNSEEYLVDCIESLINQTYKNIEIILVNDGSTDNSLTICEKYSQQYDFIKLINKVNSGVSDARNSGILVAKSELIMFVDSDDYVSTRLCETLIENYNDEDILFCQYIKFKENKGKKDFLSEYENIDNLDNIHLVSDLNKSLFEKMYDRLFFNTPVCKIYKKSKINYLFDSEVSLGEDLLFNLNYLVSCRTIKFVNKNLYFYRVGNFNSLSTRFSEHRLKDVNYIFSNAINIFSTILGDKYHEDKVKLRYLEDYAMSIKKMLSCPALSYQDKVSKLSEYRSDYPLEDNFICLIKELDFQYQFFLFLYLYKIDSILLLTTKLFNILKNIKIKGV
ncbi:MAG: glycosyltransferase [[Pasteurella] mairii]|nr:glycosyltransferase [[Pasteurella] mairii]